ncbi:hypothetical protein, partial [Phocaeicola vulgatus]|uniref:hypothetical protein n=1 Tax=Phocaeicola vulgatus TaxID=821 RepID=UPI001E297ACA
WMELFSIRIQRTFQLVSTFQVFVKIEKIFHICVFLNGIPWLFDYAIRGGHGLFFLFFTLC